MSKQSKQSKKRAISKASRGTNAGKHFAEGDSRSKYPGDQPAASWMRSTGANGWWNAPKPTPKKSEETSEKSKSKNSKN